jgi:hypothetical protein
MNTPDEIIKELYKCGEKGIVNEFNKILHYLLKEEIKLDFGKTNELYHHLLGVSQDLTVGQSRDRLKIKVNIVNCAMDLEVYESIVRGY